MRRDYWRIVVSLMVVWAFSLPGWAGWYWESEQVVRGMPGQADRTMLVKYYYTTDAARQENGEQITIMDFTSMTVYQLDPVTETYTEMSMQDMGMPGMSAEEQQQMMKSMEQFMGEVRLAPTGETQTIAGYTCEKYEMTMMMMTNEYWVTQEIEGYEDLQAIGQKVAEQFETIPMFGQMNITAMMGEMEGFPVKTVSQMPMGGTLTTTLQHIEQRVLDENLFRVPAEYRAQ